MESKMTQTKLNHFWNSSDLFKELNIMINEYLPNTELGMLPLQPCPTGQPKLTCYL